MGSEIYTALPLWDKLNYSKNMKFICTGVFLLLLSSVAVCRDIRFANGNSSLAIPFELVNNQIFFKVRFEDSPPLTFIVDTGASINVLSLKLAKKFGLGLQPFGKMGGIGANLPDAFFATDKYTLNFPRAILTDQTFLATSFDFPVECSEGVAAPLKTFDGVLGKGFFDSFVVKIDYNKKLIDLYDPQLFKYKGKGKKIALELDNGMTIIRAKIKNDKNKTTTARLIVDTGAGGDSLLTLNSQFAADNGQLPPPEKLTPSGECGIGGAAAGTSAEGKVKSLKIGDFELTDARTFFRNKSISQEYDGLLSAAALRKFNVIFDYPHKQMILEKIR